MEEQHQVSQNPTQGSQAVPEQRQTEVKHSCSLSIALSDKDIASDTLRSEMEPQCQCRKTPGATREAGTQTSDLVLAKTCNVSTQCGLVGLNSAAATGFDSSLRPVVHKLQYPARGGQRRHTLNATESKQDRLVCNSRGKITPRSFCDSTGAECDASAIRKNDP